MTTIDYMELLDWTASQIVPGKRGATPLCVPPILQRLSLSAEVWTAFVQNFWQAIQQRCWSSKNSRPNTKPNSTPAISSAS